MKICIEVHPLVSHSPGLRVTRRRGTVLLLVVAVLALLAVIGTVYIVAAKNDKEASASASATVNLNWARDGINYQIAAIIAGGNTDATGQVGGYAVSGSYGTLPAHNYDFPDSTEPWLAATIHNQNFSAAINNFSTLAASAFDPLTGVNDLSLTAPGITGFTTAGLSTVVGDQTTAATDATSDELSSGVPSCDRPTGFADSYLWLLPTSDASGIRYRYYIRIIDTSRMANLNTGAISATADPAGSYFNNVSLVTPTNATTNAFFNTNDTPANLQVSPGASTLGRSSVNSSMGNATYSLLNWQQQVLRIEKPTDPALTLFSLADQLELSAYGEYGTGNRIRPSLGSSATYTGWPYTLNSNPANPSANPTTTVFTGNPSRRNFTTYSESRQLRPYSGTVSGNTYPLTANIYGLHPATGTTPSGAPSTITTTPFPTAPACVSGNPLTAVNPSGAAGANDDFMFYTAMAATNIAALMENSCAARNFDTGAVNPNFSDGSVSYSHEEACAFAANYCTAKWNGFTPDPAITTVQAYFLPAGPSFVDGQGICIRSATSATNAVHREFGAGGTDLHAESPNKVYLGYAAQPFISEVDAKMIDDDAGDLFPVPTTVATNVTVELFNPYPVALSLNGFRLESGDGSTVNIDLTGQYIPANGFFLVSNTGSSTAGQQLTVTPAQLSVNATGTGDTRFILFRPYFQRNNLSTPAFAPIDQINYAVLVAVNGTPVLPSEKAGQQPADFSIARQGGAWGPTSAVIPGGLRITNPTLGASNASPSANYPLPDRYAYPFSLQSAQGNPFGMGEFARIMRICNEFDGTNVTGVPFPSNGMTGGPNGGANSGLIPDHIAALASSTSPYTSMMMTNATYPVSSIGSDAIDAQILFDFYGDARDYSTTASAQPADPGTGYHDIRALRLLDQISMVDRVSEFGIDLTGGAAGGTSDINKIRIPGQINVNTASGDVLRAIPNMTDQMVATIIAYRDRLQTYTYNGAGTLADFSNATNYPGKGIRSLAELAVPLANTAAATLDARDLLWGSICNYCTVRSDTFVVYGYLEAVKVHPFYNGTHNNGSDWYGAVSDNMYSAPGVPVTTAQNLRVARRRWIAIVDRSYCNYNKLLANGSANTQFVLPKIVAVKDLPQ